MCRLYIVNIISNNTVTMLLALDICVNKKAPSTHSVHWGHILFPRQNHDPFFCEAPS